MTNVYNGAYVGCTYQHSEEQTDDRCCCNDPDIERLAQLVAEGLTQREASIQLWASDPA